MNSPSDPLTDEAFERLVNAKGSPCMSIYLPTHRTAPDNQKDRIHFKNLLEAAKLKLPEFSDNEDGTTSESNLLAPAEALLKDRDFWQHQSDGLAVFLTPDGAEVYRLPHRFQNEVRVDDHLYINPLIPLVQSMSRFLLLAISQNECELYEGDRDSLRPVPVEDLPSDMKSATGWTHQPGLNLHSSQKKPQSRSGDATAVFHGHFEDETKEALKQYFHFVDEALHDVVAKRRLPLVFAGVDYLFPIYQDVNTYNRLVEESVEGNFDEHRTSIDDLHAEAWAVFSRHLEKNRAELFDRYHEANGANRATSDMAIALSAAKNGLIDTLIIPDQAQMYATITASDRDGEAANDTVHDVLDVLAIDTLTNSGQVFAVEADQMPPDCCLLAILRAPISTVAEVPWVALA